MIEKLLNLTICTETARRDGSRVTLYRGLAMPAGVETFVVRDARTGVERDATTMPSVALKILREVFALPAPTQMTSPLPAERPIDPRTHAADLRAHAETLGLEIPKSVTKTQIIEAIAKRERAQIVSPLPAAERCTSGLSTGATLTMPTAPQARVLARGAAGRGIWRYGHTYGVGITMLRALARRGWLELDDSFRPQYGTLTDAGRRALARYDAKHGTPAGAR